jgi:hypothetical protein
MKLCSRVPDLARRQPVWLALSELYLDIELEAGDFQRLAGVFAASGFSWSDIQQINYDEVAPVLWQNLLSMAGEWAGWNEVLLLASIGKRYTGKRHRCLGSRVLWLRIVDYFTADWLAKIAIYLP